MYMNMLPPSPVIKWTTHREKYINLRCQELCSASNIKSVRYIFEQRRIHKEFDIRFRIIFYHGRRLKWLSGRKINRNISELYSNNSI